MPKYHIPSLMLASVIGLTACGGGEPPSSSSTAPINQTNIIFNPATSALPITNDLMFEREYIPGEGEDPNLRTYQDGTLYADYDPTNPVITGIDSMDGRSVLAPFDIMVNGSLDPNQSVDAASFIRQGENVIPNPNQNVFLLPLAFPSGDGLSQASINGSSVEVPTFAEAITYQTAAATADAASLMELASPTARAEIISLDGGVDNVLRIIPIEPLMPKTKYLVVVTSLQDRAGQAVVPSSSYELIKDPSTNFASFGESGGALAALQPVVQGWEQLAVGYFGFKQAVYAAGGVSVPVPTADDITFSMTFTTGGTTDSLKYITAPETFFADSITSSLKQDSIVKVVSGVYQLNGSTSSDDPTDAAVAMTLNTLLTAPVLPGDTPNPLYNESIATAVGAGADYATIVGSDASAGYLIQVAAGEAAVSVANSASPTIAEQSMGTVSQIAGALGQANPANVFPIPAPRTTNFYRWDIASEINSSLVQPAMLFQGEITLPYYQQGPDGADLSPVTSADWTANATIGAVIDGASGNDPGTTPPSTKVTYRYPFPTKQTDVTVPMMVVTPVATELMVDGYEVPEKWPVIIFSHGIRSERSTALPLADALANACVVRDPTTGDALMATGLPCFATVIIDQTLHGVAPGGSLVPGLLSVNDPAYDTTFPANVGDNMKSANLMERHFNTTADATANPIPMTYDPDLGSSGSLFVNLTNFTNVRDNMRQMVLDLLNVNASIASIDVDDDAVTDLDPNKVYFVGHSLGGINGMPFVAVNNHPSVQNSMFSSQPKVLAASAMYAGGGIPKLLVNSDSFAVPILQGLASASDELTQGKSGLETYFNVFQGVLDSVDVMNFAPWLTDAFSDTGVLLTLVDDDEVIPNAADEDLWGTGPLNLTTTDGFVVGGFPAPLAGTEPMIDQFGAIKTQEVVEPEAWDGDPEVLITRFMEGSHRTPVDGQTPAAFYELIAELATFFAIDGNATTATPIYYDPSVIEE